MRDHKPVVFDKFNGLWDRGSEDEVPLDHFTECDNIKFVATSSFASRDGIGISQDVAIPLENIKRIYNYPTQTANTLIVLVTNAAGAGEIYHVVNSTLVYGPLLTITGMTDFAFIPYAGRGYISPFTSFVTGDLNIEKGLQNEFLYVYAGDGTAARKAAGIALGGVIGTIANGAAGHTDDGFHVFGFVAETSSGYLTPPGQLKSFVTNAAFSVSFGTISTSGNPNVIARHLVATKVITDFNGDLSGYQFFFVPNATIPDNTTTALNSISFYDADLLEDASHLFDNYSSIPAGAVLNLYHDRLCLYATFDDISIGLISYPGEPEAISQIDGIIIVTLDGNPITNAQEMRDVNYVMKRSRTVAFIDNGDVPASWPETIIDNALGCPVHGIATVLDSGSSSIDFLIVCTYQGVTLFNGRYNTPELSWKIENYWKQLDRNEFRKIQIVNAPVQKEIRIVLPTLDMLVGNYANGMDYKKIRWTPESYAMPINTIAIVNIDEIILGSDLVVI